jgi:hydrogenase expression/formation protein HypE
MSERIRMNHGSGGRHTHRLIEELFAAGFCMSAPLTDSAIINYPGFSAAFTTDSYVVDPLFFPGGNIGKLAVCGTVNDLAVSGAIPVVLAAAFIIEDGFPLKELREIVSAMAEEALNANVKIVTGDTKVVEKGKCDRLFITTSGLGALDPSRSHIGKAEKVKQGDILIINGPVGNHALAVLGARNKLSFSTSVESDVASLNFMINKVLDGCEGVHFMRDITRGGLATVINELSGITGLSISVDEASIPVDEPVRGICEMLGFDPLFLANEGKVLIVCDKNSVSTVLETLRSDRLGEQAEIIGEMTGGNKRIVTLNTIIGGKRILEMPSGTELPRIC